MRTVAGFELTTTGGGLLEAAHCRLVLNAQDFPGLPSQSVFRMFFILAPALGDTRPVGASATNHARPRHPCVARKYGMDTESDCHERLATMTQTLMGRLQKTTATR